MQCFYNVNVCEMACILGLTSSNRQDSRTCKEGSIPRYMSHRYISDRYMSYAPPLGQVTHHATWVAVRAAPVQNLEWIPLKQCAFLGLWIQLMLICCNALQRTATRCNALQRTTTCFEDIPLTEELWVKTVLTHCKSLQRTATYCNALRRTATHCNARCRFTAYEGAVNENNAYTLQRTATNCNALQHTATHCNTQ